MLSTAMTSTPSTTAASAALALGRTMPRVRGQRAAAMAIERAPRVVRVEPSRASSPATAYSPSREELTCPLAASRPRAIGRSNEAACLGSSAGARLITTRFSGRMYPLLARARSMRWVLSLTVASGRPTRTILGEALGETSTSTSTGTASTPNRLYVWSLASIGGPPVLG